MKALAPRLPLLLLAFAGSAFCTSIYAEDTATPPPPAPHHRPGMHGGAIVPEKRLEHLTKQLGLTAEQQQKIKPILVEQSELMKKLAESRQQLESVLTPEQLEKFKESKHGRHGHHPRQDGD